MFKIETCYVVITSRPNYSTLKTPIAQDPGVNTVLELSTCSIFFVRFLGIEVSFRDENAL